MASFCVMLLTAPPPGLGGESAGALLKVEGREALLKASELFLNRDSIVQKILVVAPAQAEEAKRKFGAHLGFSGVKLVVGGVRWMEQIAAASERVDPGITHVIVHDAARPAVAFSDIDALLAAAEKTTFAALSIPIRSTLAEVDEGGQPIAIRSASEFVQVVTPMSFDRATFDAMAKTKIEPHASTLTLVQGSAFNQRLSSPGDVGLVSAMLKLLPKPKLRAATNPFDEAQW